MGAARAPLPVRLYGAAADLIAPLAYRRVARKLAAQGTDPGRLRERRGLPTAARPAGELVWFHAASVGESLSVLRLIARLGRDRPERAFLLTSGTATSARILARRLPARTVHQFAPLDTRPAIRRFLAHWRPDAAVFVESELWPQMLRMTRAAGVPLALVNARISDTSARNWKRLPATARHLMGYFRLIHCQDARTAAHLHDLGLDGAAQGVNLKALAGPLPVDCDARDRLRTRLGQRPVWVAASTHPGEEGIMLAAHRALLEDHPDALLILVPRHPERAGDIAGDIARAGLTQARRSTGAPPETATQVYLADTLGETGLWYDLAPLTCLCGSFSDVGGHNPYEPAHAGCAILHGPRYANFAQTYAEMDAAGAARQVTGAEDLAQALRHLFDTPDDRAALAEGARAFASAQEDALDEMTATLSKALGLR